MDVNELSCIDLIMSWMEPGSFKSIPEICQRLEHTFRWKKNGFLIDAEDHNLLRNEPSDSIRKDKLDDVVEDLVSLRVSRFELSEPERLLRHRCPAPPPKLHYGTRWRNLTRKLYGHSSTALK